MLHWLLRKRVNPHTTGANSRIVNGDFGSGSPRLPVVFNETPIHYHEGDLFTPGAMNYVAEPNFELPLQTIWGFGYPYPANQFNPLQPPSAFAPPNVVTNGIGGLVAGQIALQPLSETGNEQGGA